MILGWRDIQRKRGRFVSTSIGVGLLIGAAMLQACIYRGVVADAMTLPGLFKNDLWVVQSRHFGPFTEISSVAADQRNAMSRMPGVRDATMIQFTTGLALVQGKLLRTDIVGYEVARIPLPATLIAGRAPSKPRYEAVVDRTLGVALGERLILRGRIYDVVGLTERAVGVTGQPLTFVSLPDARDISSKNAPAEIHREHFAGHDENVGNTASAILVRAKPGVDVDRLRDDIRRWKHLEVIDAPAQDDNIMFREVSRIRQTLLLFAIILLIATTGIIALTIYSMTSDKTREIATLKLIGAGNSVIMGMIVGQAVAIGVTGFCVGLAVVYGAIGVFPGYLELRPEDCAVIALITLGACVVASMGGVRLALRVPPNQALSG